MDSMDMPADRDEEYGGIGDEEFGFADPAVGSAARAVLKKKKNTAAPRILKTS